jgi:hypothetical protein
MNNLLYKHEWKYISKRKNKYTQDYKFIKENVSTERNSRQEFLVEPYEVYTKQIRFGTQYSHNWTCIDEDFA